MRRFVSCVALVCALAVPVTAGPPDSTGGPPDSTGGGKSATAARSLPAFVIELLGKLFGN